MRVRQVQTAFTAGLLGPLVSARTDLKQYYSGASVCENIELLPQGGARARWGWKHVLTLPGTAANGRLFELRLSREATYLVLLLPGEARIFHDGGQVATVSGLPWSASELAAVTVTRAAETMLLFHPSHRPKRLLRNGSHTAWSFGDMPIEVPPVYSFTKTVGVCTASEHTGTVTFSSTAPDFAGAAVNWLIRMNGGTARIKSITNSSSVMAKVIVDLTEAGGSSPAAAGAWQLCEPMWSDVHGWPACGTFYSDRLFLAGATETSEVIVASRAGVYFNFDEGEALDDEAVVYASNSDEVNSVKHLVSAAALLAMTDGGEFGTLDYPVKPSSVSAIPQTNHGIGAVRPIVVEDGIQFITGQRGSEQPALLELIYSEAAQKYQAQDLTLLCGAILSAPVDIALRRGNDLARAYHVVIVNENGSLAVLNTLRSQDVTGWSVWSTEGQILRVGVAGSDVYAVIRRGDLVALEILSADCRTDGAAMVALANPATSVAGFSHLAGQVVSVYADGYPVGIQTVSTDGRVTLNTAASVVEAGYPYTWKIAPMPFVVDLPDGTGIDEIRRVVKATIRLLATENLSINGVAVSLQALGASLLDAAAPSYSGTIVHRLLGYDRSGTLVLSGTGAATILGVTREVSI
jgi:hypothetical protein